MDRIIRASRAKSTVSKYSNSFNLWKSWCAENNVSAIPAAAEDISRYFVKLFNADAPYSRIEGVFYSIKWFHKCNPGVLLNPCDRKFLHLLLEGLKRSSAKPVQKKDPITVAILQKNLCKYGMGSNSKDIRLCVLCLLSIAGFLRNDEAINIRECDLQFHPSFIRIFLVKSKTDQYREGSWVIIAETGSITCPVHMLRRYMSRADLQEGSNSEDFLLRHVSFWKSFNGYKLHIEGLSYTRCREIFKEALKGVGEKPEKFGLHSLRPEGASAAASSGVPDRLFKKHGRWMSDGVKDGYISESLNNQLSASLNLGL